MPRTRRAFEPHLPWQNMPHTMRIYLGSHITTTSKQASDRRRAAEATCGGGYPLPREPFRGAAAVDKHRECEARNWMEWAHQSSHVYVFNRFYWRQSPVTNAVRPHNSHERRWYSEHRELGRQQGSGRDVRDTRLT